jgi:hypothetical protein
MSKYSIIYARLWASPKSWYLCITQGLPPQKNFALLLVYCTLWGKKWAPPSVNTMQYFYRLLESQKVQNNRLQRLRNRLKVLKCDAFITSAERTALTATSWANNIVFEVQTSQLQPSKFPSFGVLISALLSVLQIFWYIAPWRVVTSHLKTRRPYHAKSSCSTECTARSMWSAASVFVATLWTGTVFSASSNGSFYIRISPNSGVKGLSTGKTASLNAQFTYHALPWSNSSSVHETVGNPAWCNMFQWTCMYVFVSFIPQCLSTDP